MSLFAYPLSGGFKPWSLLPAAWTRPVLSLEEAISPWVGRLLAFRLFAVVRKTAAP